MKKLILFVALAIFVIANSNAQINFGAKAGVNFATITGDDVDIFDGRTAFHVGVVAEIVISETFSFQPELLYSAQGADYSDDEFEGTFKLDYLNIPLMAKFYVGEGFSLEAGPQVGFLMSAKDEYDFTGTAFKSEEEDIKEFVKDIDFGINVGVGYKLEGGLNFGARYNLGLSDANDSGDDSFTLKNSVIQAYVGYFF
jgi:hypothetical protein